MARLVPGSRLTSTWLAVTLVASIAGAVDGGFVHRWAALAPARIWHGEVWRLLTWMFVETSPLSLLATVVAIYVFGGDLAIRWGDRRLRRFVLELALAASVVTCAAALVAGDVWWLQRCGGWFVGDVLLVAWARQFPRRVVRIQGVLPLSGRDLVRWTVGFVLLFAVFYGPLAVVPEIVGCVAAAIYPSSRLRAA